MPSVSASTISAATPPDTDPSRCSVASTCMAASSLPASSLSRSIDRDLYAESPIGDRTGQALEQVAGRVEGADAGVDQVPRVGAHAGDVGEVG